MSKKSISIFGVTGSIGQSASDVIMAAPGSFEVRSVTAYKNAEKLAQTAIRLNAKRAVIGDETLYDALKTILAGHDIEAAAGERAIIEAAQEPVDLHLAAIVGMAGLNPLFAALGNARTVAIANKEPLVAAGALFMRQAEKTNTKILPLDSEHNAIFQVFESDNRQAIEKIILTASGGPFLNWSRKDMAAATPEQAIAHPNWSMGAKISVDSASMMNKALEIIEAHYLFDMPPEKIKVLIHPQSVVHSMVEYSDGSVLAQMGASDMRTPIAHALAWPARMTSPGAHLDFSKLKALEFFEPDMKKFPGLSMAYDCLKHGPEACIAFNAANETAVKEFLDGNLGFGDIMDCVAFGLDNMRGAKIDTLESVEACDKNIRRQVQSYIMNINEKKVKTAS